MRRNKGKAQFPAGKKESIIPQRSMSTPEDTVLSPVKRYLDPSAASGQAALILVDDGLDCWWAVEHCIRSLGRRPLLVRSEQEEGLEPRLSWLLASARFGQHPIDCWTLDLAQLGLEHRYLALGRLALRMGIDTLLITHRMEQGFFDAMRREFGHNGAPLWRWVVRVGHPVHFLRGLHPGGLFFEPFSQHLLRFCQDRTCRQRCATCRLYLRLCLAPSMEKALRRPEFRLGPRRKLESRLRQEVIRPQYPTP